MKTNLLLSLNFFLFSLSLPKSLTEGIVWLPPRFLVSKELGVLCIILKAILFPVLQIALVGGQEDGGHDVCLPGFQVKNYQLVHSGPFQKDQALLQGQWNLTEHCCFHQLLLLFQIRLFSKQYYEVEALSAFLCGS